MMTDSEDPTGIDELATASIAPIEEELRQRLLAELGDRDLLAVETALLKAFMNGMRVANSEATEATIDRAGLATGAPIAPAELDVPLPPADLWAARYGTGD
jgi:hypothetical protein